MISHAWGEDVEECRDALACWAGKAREVWGTAGDMPLWLCTFAQYQACDEAGPSLEEQLSLSPFMSVIQSWPEYGMVVLHTTRADPYERLWCVHEIDEALAVNVATRAVGRYMLGSRSVRTQQAKCGNAADEQKIRTSIERKDGGYARLDDVIRRFRQSLLKQ